MVIVVDYVVFFEVFAKTGHTLVGTSDGACLLLYLPALMARYRRLLGFVADPSSYLSRLPRSILWGLLERAPFPRPRRVHQLVSLHNVEFRYGQTLLHELVSFRASLSGHCMFL